MKPISLQEYKSTKDFVEDLKSGALFEQLKPKPVSLHLVEGVKDQFTKKSDSE